MRTMTLIALTLSAASVAGCTITCPAPAGAQIASAPLPAPPAPPPPAQEHGGHPPRADAATSAHHLYRLDFTITGTNASGTYTMNLEEGRMGEIMSGANVPVSPNGTSRMDVGLKLRASYALLGDDLLVDSETEMSTADDPSGVHKLNAHGQALVTPGKPGLVASIDDPAGKKKVQVNLTATKLH